jgi:sugar phosphate isomerase/epimerase
VLLGLETFSYHLALGHGRMDVFEFIRRTHALGLDGVQLNMVAKPPSYGHLGSGDADHLRAVRALIEKLGLYVEIDTNQTDAASLHRALDVCMALGAKALRTYQVPTGDTPRDMDAAVEVFKEVLPRCEKEKIRIGFENHEYETAQEILSVIQRVDSQWVGAMIDNGNGMMVWEDPDVTVETLLPHVVTTHFKDHAVIEEVGRPIVAGVTLGEGSMDLKKHFELLSQSPLKWINIEVCNAYRAPFRRPQNQGAGGKIGQGAFAVLPGPFEPSFIPPVQRGRDDLDQRLQWEEQAVRKSVEYVKRLRDEISPGGR